MSWTIIINVLSSLPTLGWNYGSRRHMASAKCEPIMGARGLAELLVVVRWGQSPPPWGWKPCSLRASHGNGNIAPFSLFWKLNTQRPTCTMHIWCVSKNNYVDVWVASMWYVPHCHSRKYNGNSVVRILSWFGSCTSPLWRSCRKCWAQIRTDDKPSYEPGFFFGTYEYVKLSMYTAL